MNVVAVIVLTVTLSVLSIIKYDPVSIPAISAGVAVTGTVSAVTAALSVVGAGWFFATTPVNVVGVTAVTVTYSPFLHGRMFGQPISIVLPTMIPFIDRGVTA